MPNLILACLVLAFGGAGLAVGQDVPAAPVIKLSVVAVDERGQPVNNLTREEFQVFDGGQPRHIASFRRTDAKTLRMLPPARNELSNRSGTPLVHATVILFDLLNAMVPDQVLAASHLVRELRHVEAGESLFLYMLTMEGRLYAIHPLPGAEDRGSGSARPWTEDIKPLLDDAMRQFSSVRPRPMVDDRVRMTYRALELLAKRVGLTPGRKSIIWISHGVPISIGGGFSDLEQIDYRPLLQRLTATLDRANVAVYTVRQPVPVAGGGNPATRGMASTETLEEFAALTGGRACGNLDIACAIRHAANDARLSYLIAFDPPLEQWDGRYHKIRVVCTRKGVKLQTKQGYYAFAAEAHEGDQESAALAAAVSSPFDIPEVGLYGRLVATGKAAGEWSLEVRIDPADVAMAREGDVFACQLAVDAAAYSADGRAESGNLGTLALRQSAEEREQALREGFSVARLITLPPTIRKLRVMVYDRSSGAVGSLTLPVPDGEAKP